MNSNVGTTASIMTGILLVTPTRKENIADDLGDIVDLMDSGEYVILEFKEELVFDTINDYVNGDVSSLELLWIEDYSITSRFYSPEQMEAYLGL